MSYPGGKGGAGIAQTIINQMPPHEVYIEPFVGGGAVLKAKRPAARNIACDLDRNVCRYWSDARGLEVYEGCGILFLQRMMKWIGRELVYCDPPYPMSVRRSQERMYEHEMGDLDHAILLDTIHNLPCMVMISGYRCPLYDRALAEWRSIDYTAPTRGGRPATETLWMNFPEPQALHDYRHLGRTFRERQGIKRKCARWRAKLDGLDPLERQAILSALLDRA